MEYRILGPLEVVEAGRSLPLGGPKQRSLLAVLLLRANEVVSTDDLIDRMWGEQAPPTAAKVVQVQVWRLRKTLGADALVTRPPGYVLRVGPDELDLARFERLVGEARAAERATGAEKLRDALALWRGSPLADLAFESFFSVEIARLEELRVAALEERIETDLALGRHAELVPELESLVVEHPLRERLHGQLMLALYRSGRQAEALEAYRRTRELLVEELGLEPGEELKRLEKAILSHDPALEVAAPSVRTAAAPERPMSERSILVVPHALDRLPALLRLAEPLAGSQPPRELIVAHVVDGSGLASATEALRDYREALLARGLVARTAAFTSSTPGEDIVRLVSQQEVDLLLMDAGLAPLEDETGVVLEQAACDIALLLESGGSLGAGPVVVPFGAGEHDWAALELGAWVARTTGAPLRLIGAASDGREERRDASRLLADASLIVQRTAGVVAEPLLASPGRAGVMALAEGAGLLVVGLSERWRQEGLGKVRAGIAESPPAPTVFVRRGPRPGGLAPAETRTRFTWSLSAAGG